MTRKGTEHLTVAEAKKYIHEALKITELTTSASR